MKMNFKVGDQVEVLRRRPVIGEDGEFKYRRNRRGYMDIVFKDQWSGFPETVEAIDCGKTKRIKVGGECFVATRLRFWA